MSTPSAPGHAHDAVLDRLADELADVSRRVQGIRADLGTLRLAPEVASAAGTPAPGTPAPGTPAPMTPGAAPPARPPDRPIPPAVGRPGAAPPRFGPWPYAPAPGGPPASGFRPGWAPPGGRPAESSPAGADADGPAPTGSGMIARLLAVTGATVTLLGVVLLLVLAANRGWFGPGARVVGGGVLGIALVGSGIALKRRLADHSDRVTAAVALAATGVAALFLTVAAASSLYDYLPVPVALALALVVTGAGLALADRWRHRGLALGVLVGGDLAVPLVVGAATPLLVALLVAAQVGAVVVARRRGWVVLAVLAVAGSTLGALAAAVRTAVSDVDTPATIAVVLVVLAAGVATALLARAQEGLAALVLAAPVLPVLVGCLAVDRAPGAAVAGLTALALLVLVVVLDRGPRPTGALAWAAGAAATVALLVATARALDGVPLSLVLLGEALVLTVIAVGVRRGGPLLAAVPFGVTGLLRALVVDVPLSWLVHFSDDRLYSEDATGPFLTSFGGTPIGAVAVSLVLVAASLTGLLALSRLDLLGTRERAWTAAGGLGLVALYGATGAVVSLALLVSPTRTGFVTGHVLVTISWTAVALVLLARGLRSSLPRVLGGVLVVAAVAKLILFDLTALDGVGRVAVFLGAGIVLLVAGVYYARALDDESSATSAASSSRVGPADAGGRPEA